MTPIGDVSSRILAAATLAEQAAATLAYEHLGQIWQNAKSLKGRREIEDAYLMRASGPSHWGAVAELLRASLEIHQGWHVCATGNDGVTDYEIDSEDGLSTCPTLAALFPLVDQIIRDLGDGT